MGTEPIKKGPLIYNQRLKKVQKGAVFLVPTFKGTDSSLFHIRSSISGVSGDADCC